MNINIAVITVGESRMLRTIITNKGYPQYPAMIVSHLLAQNFPVELANVNWDEALDTCYKGKSYACYTQSSSGNDLYIGVSCYSMFAAVGAAAVEEFEVLDPVET